MLTCPAAVAWYPCWSCEACVQVLYETHSHTLCYITCWHNGVSQQRYPISVSLVCLATRSHSEAGEVCPFPKEVSPFAVVVGYHHATHVYKCHHDNFNNTTLPMAHAATPTAGWPCNQVTSVPSNKTQPHLFMSPSKDSCFLLLSATQSASCWSSRESSRRPVMWFSYDLLIKGAKRMCWRLNNPWCVRSPIVYSLSTWCKASVMLSGRPVILVEMFARSGCGSTVPVAVLLASHVFIKVWVSGHTSLWPNSW